MRRNQEKSARRHRAAGRLFESASLNAMAQNALERIVRVVARCGANPDDIAAVVINACAAVPSTWRLRGLRATPEIGDASHVLTVWHSDVAYVTPSGPRALPLTGPAPSLSALIRVVDPSLNPGKLLAYLVRLEAVRRVGNRYVPRTRSLLLRGQRGPDYFRTLRVLNGSLTTLSHNVENDDPTQGWFEYIAENSRFPLSQRDALDAEVRRQGHAVLGSLDDFMHLKETEREAGEPVTKVGIGFKFWEDVPGDSARTVRRPARKRRRRGRG